MYLEFDVRLIGGNSKQGRVAIFTNGDWGTICEQGFGEYEAAVVCRQLGYHGPNPKIHNGIYFGGGIGPVHMQNLKCRRNANHIDDQCEWKIPNSGSNCDSHQRDVGVTCFDGKGTILYITKYIALVIYQVTLTLIPFIHIYNI